MRGRTMPEVIKAHESPIVNIFDNNYRFVVPDYQRPYAWTTEQTGELLGDLLDAVGSIDATNKVNDAHPYFLGSVVIIKGNDLEPHAEIIDGQQRITTLTIMFCALRELAATEPIRAGRHARIQETSNPDAGITGEFRLTVRKRDEDFFRNNIQKEGKLPVFVKSTPTKLPDSQQRMFENAKHLWDELQKLDANKRNVLAAFLVQRCMLVIVAASGRASAYRIFSVMNDRGLDLSPTDILKADIIGPMDDEAQTRYTDKWEDIEENLGRDGFRNLFAHIRMIFIKDKMRRGALQQQFQEDVLDGVLKQKGTDNAGFIDDVLAPHADAYVAITKSASHSDEANKFLRYLNGLNNIDWIPPAMAFFQKNLNDADALARFFRDLERLAYALYIMGSNTNGRISRYARILRAIERGDDLYAEASPLQLSPEDKTAVLNALGSQIASNRVRTMLLRLDSALADGGATYDHPIITIEHVLPQNPKAGSEWMANFSDDERREWTGKLANLVLLSRRKNSSAQNYEFDRKKREYFQRAGVAPFALTTQVVSESEWTPDVLERRQRSLIDALKKEWQLG